MSSRSTMTQVWLDKDTHTMVKQRAIQDERTIERTVNRLLRDVLEMHTTVTSGVPNIITPRAIVVGDQPVRIDVNPKSHTTVDLPKSGNIKYTPPIGTA